MIASCCINLGAKTNKVAYAWSYSSQRTPVVLQAIPPPSYHLDLAGWLAGIAIRLGHAYEIAIVNILAFNSPLVLYCRSSFLH